MTEKRARDLKIGDRFREIGSLDDTFHEIVGLEATRLDDVLVDVDVPGRPPVSWPVLDGDDVVEVEG